MALATAWPCAGPRSNVRRISRSRVPCSSSTRSFCSLVDILGENKSLPVECQCEPPHDESRIAGKPKASLIAKAGMLKTDAAPKTLRLAGCRVGSYTGGPANWRFQRWGRPLGLTFLGLSNRACKITVRTAEGRLAP